MRYRTYGKRRTDKPFFIPRADGTVLDESDAEGIWEGTRKWAQETTGWEVSDQRIFSIKYHHEGKDYYAEVGRPDPRVEETVLVILKSNTFLVCTYNRGVKRGGPILVGENEAIEVTYFEPPATKHTVYGRPRSNPEISNCVSTRAED